MRFRAAVLTGAVLAMWPAAQASADVQTITASIKPIKLDNRKFTPVSTSTDIVTAVDRVADPNADQPPSQTRTRIDLPKNLRFDFDAIPHCKTSARGLDGTTTAQAIAACGKKSKTTDSSGTSAHLVIDNDIFGPFSSTQTYDVDVTGFNAREPKTIYLHTRVDELSSTIVIVGKFKPGPKGYGSTLEIDAPPLALGALDDFQTEFTRSPGLLGRCKSKVNRFRVRTDYSNHASSVAETTAPCK